ncbi:MAG TPA: hypothetical protein VFJ74_03560 [Gemmatimonadaceae bacterium]|nr:hypothetical protein [Gemmatimonadaceae bacterium]
MSDIDKRRGDDRNSNGSSDGADPEVTRLLRDAYRAPATPGYWDGLEGRIMARVRESVRQSVRVSGSVPAVAVEWWQVLSGWVAPGAWAAAIAALVALGAMLQSRAAERRVAYARVLEASTIGTSVVGGAADASADEALRRPDRIALPPRNGDAAAARGRVPDLSDPRRDSALRDLLAPR